MTRKHAVILCGIGLVTAFALSLLTGCAAKKAAPAGAGSLALEYRLPPGSPLVYKNTQNATQTMQVMNQYTNIDTRKSITFTLVPAASKDGKQVLKVTIDSLAASMTVPQGEFAADAAQVLGKTFEMALSPLGRETDITGADVVQYSLGQAGSRSVKSDFQSIFPNLAGKPIKPGDTWTTTDTLDVDESGMKLQIITANLNTFEGFEDVAGLKCARIGTASTGTVKGEGEQQGMKVTLESTLTGTDLWFFAPAPGLLAKLTSDVSMTGTVAVGGPQGMQIPMKQQMKTETVLVK
jgi:hypothetical protein